MSEKNKVFLLFYQKNKFFKIYDITILYIIRKIVTFLFFRDKIRDKKILKNSNIFFSSEIISNKELYFYNQKYIILQNLYLLFQIILLLLFIYYYS